MDDIWDHPFAEVWWKEGVQPAFKDLAERGMTVAAVIDYMVVLMAIELRLALVGRCEELRSFWDDIRDDENASKLDKQVFDNLKNMMAQTIIDVALSGKKHKHIVDIDEDSMIEHAKSCTEPDCPVKEMVNRADKAIESLDITGVGSG